MGRKDPDTLETGRIARQADGAVLATYGETVVLCAVTAAKSVKEGQDFFPLTVHYQEKYSAAGRIPGGFFKRERGATEKETLYQPPDRPPGPPAVPRRFLQRNQRHRPGAVAMMARIEPDMVAMIAASAALTISGVPFMGPIGAARVGYIDGEYIAQPDAGAGRRRRARPGRRRHRHDAVMMVESEAKELSEETCSAPCMFAHDEMQEGHQRDHRAGRKGCQGSLGTGRLADNTADMKDKLKKLIGKDIAAAYKLTDKSARSNALNAARAKAKEAFADADRADPDGRDQADEEARGRNRPRRHPQGRQPHRRPQHHDRSARSKRWSASCRAPMVRRCSPAAKRRRSAPPRWAPRMPSR